MDHKLIVVVESSQLAKLQAFARAQSPQEDGFYQDLGLGDFQTNGPLVTWSLDSQDYDEFHLAPEFWSEAFDSYGVERALVFEEFNGEGWTLIELFRPREDAPYRPAETIILQNHHIPQVTAGVAHRSGVIPRYEAVSVSRDIDESSLVVVSHLGSQALRAAAQKRLTTKKRLTPEFGAYLQAVADTDANSLVAASTQGKSIGVRKLIRQVRRFASNVPVSLFYQPPNQMARLASIPMRGAVSHHALQANLAWTPAGLVR